MSKKLPILCPGCESSWRGQGKLDNMVENCSLGNPCDVCGSSSQRCTQLINAAERARFERESEKKSKKMLEKKE